MATCAACGLTILFGGKRVDDLRFCSDKCLAKGRVLSVAQQIPYDAVARLAATLHRGPCPKCQGPGPIDVHKTHTVWSAVYVTSWKSTPNIVCRSCGTKAQLLALLSSTVLGWVGIPLGHRSDAGADWTKHRRISAKTGPLQPVRGTAPPGSAAIGW